MILELLSDIFFGLVTLVLSLIPDITINGDIFGGFSALGSFVGYVSDVLNIPIILSCITFTILIDNASFIVKIFNFIIRKIPGVS